MNYQITKSGIIIKDTSDFNIEHILECGQIFTYKKLDVNKYEVYSKDNFALVEQTDSICTINTTNPEYFVDFFDLKTDYSHIKQKLSTNANLTNAINYGNGIRILKQDLLEVIIGFIISANNNIERIKGIMARLRQFGQNYGHYYSFPTLTELSKITEEQFKQIGAGYRAKYLVKVIEQLGSVNFDETYKMKTPKLRDWLLSLCGVGPKVADCILLFGYMRGDSFPVDTWIEKVYIDMFKKNKSRQEMSKDFINYFGELSGYAQQYLFYYKRNFEKQ